jgi:pimeloyl-ACP methyl ester carboxylesterase
MNVYFIAGLGADARVFKHIRLPDGYEIQHLNWLTPFPNESLAEYACRMGEGIDDSAPFVLAGLSMGGMIAAEIAKIKKPKSTILISSVPTAQQLPKRFRVAQWFRLHKLIPIALLKNFSILKRSFSADSKEDQLLLIDMIKCCDPQFIRWAINAILQWRNNSLPNPLLHIHGTKDEILPFKYTHPTHAIHKGTHVMILSRAAEINELLQVYLMDKNNFHTNLA